MNQLFQWLADLLRGARLWFVVQPWQAALRTRCGRKPRVFGPGWHWRWPILDQVAILNNRLRIGTFPSTTVTTLDGRTITASGLVGFRIEDPLRALMALQQPEQTCAALAMVAVAQYLSQVTASVASEPGTSLRAAGWARGPAVRGRSWSCPSRPRVDRHPTVDKVRWQVGAW